MAYFSAHIRFNKCMRTSSTDTMRSCSMHIMNKTCRRGRHVILSFKNIATGMQKKGAFRTQGVVTERKDRLPLQTSVRSTCALHAQQCQTATAWRIHTPTTIWLHQ